MEYSHSRFLQADPFYVFDRVLNTPLLITHKLSSREDNVFSHIITAITGKRSKIFL